MDFLKNCFFAAVLTIFASSMQGQSSLSLDMGVGLGVQVDGGAISRYQESRRNKHIRLGYQVMVGKGTDSWLMKETLLDISLFNVLVTDRFNDLDAEYVSLNSSGIPVSFTYVTQLYGLEIHAFRQFGRTALTFKGGKQSNSFLYVGIGFRSGFKISPRPFNSSGTEVISGYSLMDDERTNISYRSNLSTSPFISGRLDIELFKPVFTNRMISLQVRGQFHPFSTDQRTTTIVTSNETIKSNSRIDYSHLSIGLVTAI